MQLLHRGIGLALVLACMWLAPDVRAGGLGAEQQIESLESEMRAASIGRDAAFFERTLADDFVHTGPSGEAITKAELIADTKSGALTYDVLDRNDVKVRMYGDTAVVTERDLMKGSFRNHYFSGRYCITRVWVRQRGKWVVASSQATFFVEPLAPEGDGANTERRP